MGVGKALIRVKIDLSFNAQILMLLLLNTEMALTGYSKTVNSQLVIILEGLV